MSQVSLFSGLVGGRKQNVRELFGIHVDLLTLPTL
jgi:hypothetical protein